MFLFSIEPIFFVDSPQIRVIYGPSSIGFNTFSGVIFLVGRHIPILRSYTTSYLIAFIGEAFIGLSEPP